MNITIGRYSDELEPETANVYESFIEPEDRSWILFVEKDGTPALFMHREADGGVICLTPAVCLCPGHND